MTTTILHHPRSTRFMFGAFAVAALVAAIAISTYRLTGTTGVTELRPPDAVSNTIQAGPNQDLAPDWGATSTRTSTAVATTHAGPNQDLAPDWGVDVG